MSEFVREAAAKVLGGEGSGNYGHSGLDNVWGGSSGGGGGKQGLRKQAEKYKTAEEFYKMSGKRIVENIDKLSVPEQVKVDINLHNRYIETSKNKSVIKSLQENTKEKQKILDIFEGKNKNPEDIKRAINVLSEGQEIHRFWAKKGGRFGGKVWNNKWVEIYDNWKSQLTDIWEKAQDE